MKHSIAAIIAVAAMLFGCGGASETPAPDAEPPTPTIANGIAGAEFVVFESSGHFAPIEEPEAFSAAVFGFLGVPPTDG